MGTEHLFVYMNSKNNFVSLTCYTILDIVQLGKNLRKYNSQYEKTLLTPENTKAKGLKTVYKIMGFGMLGSM